MAKTGRTAFDKGYQSRVGQFARALLQDISKEVRDELKKQNLIKDNFHFFEIGSGGARNLWYIWKENDSITLSCNDFWEDASRQNMHKDIKEIINFYEGDTEDVLNELPKINIDVLLSVDHMMHLPRTKGSNVIKLINDKIKPKYVVLRERSKEYETPEEIAQSYPRNYHNYENLEKNYELFYEKAESEVAKEYFIRFYKLKK